MTYAALVRELLRAAGVREEDIDRGEREAEIDFPGLPQTEVTPGQERALRALGLRVAMASPDELEALAEMRDSVVRSKVTRN